MAKYHTITIPPELKKLAKQLMLNMTTLASSAVGVLIASDTGEDFIQMPVCPYCEAKQRDISGFCQGCNRYFEIIECNVTIYQTEKK